MGRETWGSRIGFILAAAGSAIGLGNVWKFPYKAGESGGAAFVLVYLLCIAFVGLSIMIAEIIMGRSTQLDMVGGFRKLSPGSPWFLAGALGIASGFVILSYYSVVGGWTLAYICKAAAFRFAAFHDPAEAGASFERFTAHPVLPVACHALFMALCMYIVARGVRGGIERWNNILMPALFLLLLALLVRGLTLPGAGEGLAFFLRPDFSKFHWGRTTLVALGHAFFSLSLGMGAMFTYGSYLSPDVNVPRASFYIVLLDTAISMLAGVAIFTAVFAMGLRPDAGPGLVFHTLPVVFTLMPGGYVFGVVFFVLLALAALTSAISLLEVVCAYFVDERRWPRRTAVLRMGTLILLLGVPAALSFGPLAGAKIFFGRTFFDFEDVLSSNYMLPFGGLLLSIFVGWVWGADRAVEACRIGNPRFRSARLWAFAIRYLAPLAVAAIILHQLEILPRVGALLAGGG
ncbi:MAG: sodium-dependent transporter [bacterium]|nr:sodium-dependent transporter [bacterium]